MEGALKGLADGLDPDSAYLTQREVAAVDPVRRCRTEMSVSK